MIPFVSRIEISEQATWIRLLSASMPDESILPFADLSEEQKQQCDIAIVANPDPQDLLALPNIKWVHSLWAGVEGMVNELPSPSFSIVRLIDPDLAKTMSEAVLAWTLYLHRDMPIYRKHQSERTWCQKTMVRAQDRRIGVLGLGALGKASAQRLVDNGFSVSGWSRGEKHIEGINCFHDEDGLASLLKQSDILVCLLPLTAQTQGLLNHQTLSYLPADASLINFARGPIVDDEALLKKLDQQRIGHAVLDVFMQEPLPDNHPYWINDRVTVLPHISAPTHPLSACEIVAKNIKGYRLTGELPTTVDPVLGY